VAGGLLVPLALVHGCCLPVPVGLVGVGLVELASGLADVSGAAEVSGLALASAWGTGAWVDAGTGMGVMVIGQIVIGVGVGINISVPEAAQANNRWSTPLGVVLLTERIQPISPLRCFSFAARKAWAVVVIASALGAASPQYSIET